MEIVWVATVATLSSSWQAIPSRTGTRPSIQVHNYWDQQVPYNEALAWQRRLLSERVDRIRNSDNAQSRPNDVLLIMQHPAVLTLGTRSTLDNVRSTSAPFDLVRTERGGEVTYHGPGQLVMYPILDLRNYRQDVHWYMRSLEEVAMRVVHSVGLPAGRVDGLTGVWIEDAKVCAIGVKLSRWVTMHGLAINVDVDLTHFEHIVPCGIADRPVTSLRRALQDRAGGHHGSTSDGADQASMAAVQALLIKHFAEVFDAQLVPADADAEAHGDQLICRS